MARALDCASEADARCDVRSRFIGWRERGHPRGRPPRPGIGIPRVAFLCVGILRAADQVGARRPHPGPPANREASRQQPLILTATEGPSKAFPREAGLGKKFWGLTKTKAVGPTMHAHSDACN